MISPRTDWTTDTLFNVVDYNRITKNLNEVAMLLGLSIVAYASITENTIATVTMRSNIANHANTIAAKLGLSTRLDFSTPRWFTATELNFIESLVNIQAGKFSEFGDGAVLGLFNVLGGGVRG